MLCILRFAQNIIRDSGFHAAVPDDDQGNIETCANRHTAKMYVKLSVFDVTMESFNDNLLFLCHEYLSRTLNRGI